MKPRLLDLFCGAGGAAMGYSRAGFDVVGVDIKPQKHFPFHSIVADVLTYLKWSDPVEAGYVAIHASPPCQRFSVLAHRNNNAHKHPDLIAPVRELLEQTGLPYVIENVERSPLKDPMTLCGTMFPRLRVLRHRLFETNFHLPQVPHPAGPHPLCYTRDKRKAHYGSLDEMIAFVTVTGGGNCSVRAASDAMGIDWMTKDELNEAIPPAYTEHVGAQLMQYPSVR